ncbi:MAG: hypothetical protein M1820_009668 [Bogoriella megaspora]|nr:MAG: hypothetical protein M1820_009668 [Bogoriella megaspora]
MSIFPYIYYMIESFHITNDESRIAFYAGMVTSAFALAEFATGALWGRLSDVVGRKPVLLCGLAGTGISMVAFGFAPNLPTALIARALGGLLNGNIGVLQTTVAEVVTVEAHRPRAYSIMPFVWCLGSIIGSGLGGTLANSAKSYPAVFQQGSIFERFPYLLPNMVCAVVVILSLLVGILFLEETLEDKKSRRDVGLACGRWIVSCFGRTVPHCSIGSSKQNYLDQTLALLDEDDLVLAYDSSEKSQCFACCNPVQPDPPAYRIHATQAITYSASVNAELPEQTVNTVSDVSLEKEEHGGTFTYQVVLNIVSFGILA